MIFPFLRNSYKLSTEHKKTNKNVVWILYCCFFFSFLFHFISLLLLSFANMGCVVFFFAFFWSGICLKHARIGYTRLSAWHTYIQWQKKNNKCVFVLILVSSIVFKYYSVLCILKYQLNQSQSQWIALELLFFVCFAFKSYAYAKTCCELLFKSFVQPLSW